MTYNDTRNKVSPHLLEREKITKNKDRWPSSMKGPADHNTCSLDQPSPNLYLSSARASQSETATSQLLFPAPTNLAQKNGKTDQVLPLASLKPRLYTAALMQKKKSQAPLCISFLWISVDQCCFLVNLLLKPDHSTEGVVQLAHREPSQIIHSSRSNIFIFSFVFKVFPGTPDPEQKLPPACSPKLNLESTLPSTNPQKDTILGLLHGVID